MPSSSPWVLNLWDRFSCGHSSLKQCSPGTMRFEQCMLVGDALTDDPYARFSSRAPATVEVEMLADSPDMPSPLQLFGTGVNLSIRSSPNASCTLSGCRSPIIQNLRFEPAFFTGTVNLTEVALQWDGSNLFGFESNPPHNLSFALGEMGSVSGCRW